MIAATFAVAFSLGLLALAGHLARTRNSAIPALIAAFFACGASCDAIRYLSGSEPAAARPAPSCLCC